MYEKNQYSPMSNSVSRMIMVAIAFIIQITWIMLLLFKFQNHFAWASTFLNILAFLVALRIVGQDTNAAFKLPWLIFKGDAVQSLSASFLEMWHYSDKKDEDYSQYLYQHPYKAKEKAFISPYADTPTDHSTTGEDVYLNAIKNAKKSIYIATPYFIISDEMNRELAMASKRGIEVKIITPGIPDKKLIYRVTRSYYTRLAAKGVHFYEFTPGFIHQKQLLVDEEIAVVGTINFDYRSLYHHFENGVLFYGFDAVAEVYKDFENIIHQSQDVTKTYRYKRSSLVRIADIFLRLSSPLF